MAGHWDLFSRFDAVLLCLYNVMFSDGHHSELCFFASSRAYSLYACTCEQHFLLEKKDSREVFLHLDLVQHS